ncbi:hypothetical protein ANPL_01940 [Anaplasma platys]|uniref:Uncharacterized protein n=1 Tax=Anaplasma platys TaxID=949 RepID=A0A858PY46_9RICK|nr:hypothetical protein [Anaplasma platys]QJC27488.1 hypothetical protein ANPL_01940 [Anaplasma platys]
MIVVDPLSSRSVTICAFGRTAPLASIESADGSISLTSVSLGSGISYKCLGINIGRDCSEKNTKTTSYL